jgi:hypothetical protein
MSFPSSRAVLVHLDNKGNESSPGMKRVNGTVRDDQGRECG